MAFFGFYALVRHGATSLSYRVATRRHRRLALLGDSLALREPIEDPVFQIDERPAVIAKG
jgi:hypothetical protein